MISEKEAIRVSKFLSLVLRHEPGSIGIELDSQGWTNVNGLIAKINAAGTTLTLDQLKYIVDTSPKKRFSFNDTMEQIRASQGHSVEVELGYTPKMPPVILYHGTGLNAVAQIQREGLRKGERHHVHLSPDVETATKVGTRHGKPFVFEVLAQKMHDDKFEFFQSENGVWLTERVPAEEFLYKLRSLIGFWISKSVILYYFLSV